MTDTARVWVTIVLAGAGTFLARISFLGVAHRMADPPIYLQRVLRMIPPAALAALVLPSFVRPGGTFDLTQPRFFAGVIATIVAFWTKNVLVTLAVGMTADAAWLTEAGIECMQGYYFGAPTVTPTALGRTLVLNGDECVDESVFPEIQALACEALCGPYGLLHREDERPGLRVGEDRGGPGRRSDRHPDPDGTEPALAALGELVDLVGDVVGQGDEVPRCRPVVLPDRLGERVAHAPILAGPAGLSGVRGGRRGRRAGRRGCRPG